jgi:hypothetical protein
MAAMFALLSNHGILTEVFVLAPETRPLLVTSSARDSVVSRLVSPDSPPPRA